MHVFRRWTFVHIRVLLCAILIVPSAALAITPSQEEELSEEFMRVALKNFQFVEDPLIVDYVNQIGQKIIAVLPTQPFNYHFYIIKSDVYNAFAIPAGHIYINSGLLAAMETEDELAGILGHEIAHVTARHISDKIERSKKITAVTLAGMIAGVFLGAAGGSPDAAQALTTGAIAAGQSLSLAYSRDDERQADQLGLRFLDKAGYSGRGLVSVLHKIRSKQWYGTNEFPDYLSTHPGTEERLANVGAWIQQNPEHPAAGEQKRTDAFAMAHTRLVAGYSDENQALREFEMAVARDPQDPMALYGYGLVLTRKGNLSSAAVQLRKALEQKAFDPYLLNALGRVYFLDGHYAEATNSLKGALSISRDNPETLFLLGRTQMEMGDLNGALAAFENLISLKPEYPEAAFFLGRTYGKLGTLDQAHYYLGLHYRKSGDTKNAQFHLQKALPLTKDPIRRDQIEDLLRELKKEKKKDTKT